MEVSPGYKQTEAGVIPQDWEVDELRSFVRRHNSGIYKKSELYGKGCNIVGVSDLYGIDCVDGQRFAEVPLTPKEQAKHTLACNDLVYGESSLVREGIARTVYVTERGAGTAFAWHTRRYAIDQGKLFSPYLYYYLQSHCARKHMMDQSIQTAITGINTVAYFACPIACPCPDEQRAIAAALSEVDALLGGLDRLIGKKRDLEQAAMQQLLTGQTRLPGFSGEWEVKRLKEAAEISTGINKPLTEMGSGALYVTVQDLYDGTSIRTNRLSRIKVSQSEIDAKSLAVGDIVFGKSSVKREGIGYPSQFLGCEEPVVFSGFTYRARARHGLADAVFLFYALRTEETRRWLIDNSQASALTNINQQIADAIPVQVPPTVHEQAAIAEILSDMDAEITGLEVRRDKTRGLKQAMMQELLTGKRRLVPAGAPHA